MMIRSVDEFKRHTYTPNDYYDYLKVVENGLSGDITIVPIPATLGSSAAVVNAAIQGEEEKFARSVHVKLVDTSGSIHKWFNGYLTVAASKNSTSGTVAIKDGATSMPLVNGEGDVIIEYTGTWAEGDTATLTVSGTVLGYTLTQKTSVDTLVA